MATSGGKRTVGQAAATVAEVVALLEKIEAQCRYARLLLQQLDPKTPIKLTKELKGLAKKVTALQPVHPETC